MNSHALFALLVIGCTTILYCVLKLRNAIDAEDSISHRYVFASGLTLAAVILLSNSA